MRKQRLELCIGSSNLLWGCAAKYDVAISTACGALDYVVVDTTNTAQQCVELLRRKQLGIATFLVLVRPGSCHEAFMCCAWLPTVCRVPSLDAPCSMHHASSALNNSTATSFDDNAGFLELSPAYWSRVAIVAGQATAPGAGNEPEVADARGGPAPLRSHPRV